jgi:hypothetical protein
MSGKMPAHIRGNGRIRVGICRKLVPFRLGLDRGLILRDLEEMDGASDSEEVVAEETGCGDAAIAQGGDGEESNEWIAAGRASGAAD